MPLIPVSLPTNQRSLPGNIRRFLDEADSRIEQLQSNNHIPGFVPSDFVSVYAALEVLQTTDLIPGPWFCEWGSGMGVVACLAALLGFDAWGIEIDATLVGEARRLAADFDLPARFVRGSFIPAEAEIEWNAEGRFEWLTTEERDGYTDLGLEPDEFDVIFAYPWPDEEELTAQLFEQYARPGALLVTYQDSPGVRVWRKYGAARNRGVGSGPIRRSDRTTPGRRGTETHPASTIIAALQPR